MIPMTHLLIAAGLGIGLGALSMAPAFIWANRRAAFWRDNSRQWRAVAQTHQRTIDAANRSLVANNAALEAIARRGAQP